MHWPAQSEVWLKIFESGYHHILILRSHSERNLGPGDRLAYIMATGAGAGLLPGAPGTFGSVEGLALFLALSVAAGSKAIPQLNCWVFLAFVNLFVFGAGVWASGRVSLLMRTADPGRVVIDEISGQLISLTPLLLAPTWLSVLLGFVLFRAFDIFKPFPINKLERLPGGWGIMADDAGAGILTAAILLAVRLARLA